jgi:hypothetical protein
MKKMYVKPEVLCDEEIGLQELITAGGNNTHQDSGGDPTGCAGCNCSTGSNISG